MADDARSPQEVLKDHLRQGQSGSIEADLDRNYAEDVVVLSRHGVFHGHDGVRQLQKLLSEEAPRARFTYKTQLLERDVGLLEWSAESDEAVIRDGAESYVIRDGRIVAQTMASASPATSEPACNASTAASTSRLRITPT